MWMYKWESPDPERWSSTFSFKSFEEAKDSAIWHARTAHKRKKLGILPLEKKQKTLIWRSLTKAGWHIRKKKHLLLT